MTLDLEGVSERPLYTIRYTLLYSPSHSNFGKPKQSSSVHDGAL